jgi:hypothetical protein
VILWLDDVDSLHSQDPDRTHAKEARKELAKKKKEAQSRRQERKEAKDKLMFIDMSSSCLSPKMAPSSLVNRTSNVQTILTDLYIRQPKSRRTHHLPH